MKRMKRDLVGSLPSEGGSVLRFLEAGAGSSLVDSRLRDFLSLEEGGSAGAVVLVVSSGVSLCCWTYVATGSHTS